MSDLNRRDFISKSMIGVISVPILGTAVAWGGEKFKLSSDEERVKMLLIPHDFLFAMGFGSASERETIIRAAESSDETVRSKGSLMFSDRYWGISFGKYETPLREKIMNYSVIHYWHALTVCVRVGIDGFDVLSVPKFWEKNILS